MAYEFYAFISYKRGEADEKWARRLQAELERYRIPVADLRGKASPGRGGENALPKRLKVFRDKSDLGSHSSVEDGLSENLDVSRFLLVICSRRGAQSPYVDAEVRRFVETGRQDQIVPLAIDASAARPPSLPADVEPVAASGDHEETFIQLLARLLRVDRDNLRQAHLRAARRRAAFRLASVAAVLLLTAGLALWAVSAEKRATERRIESEALVDFLTFDLMRECTGWLPYQKTAAIADRVMEYYERWEARSPRAALVQAVNLVQQAGTVELAYGRTSAAMTIASQALERFERLQKDNPHDEAVMVEYSRAVLFTGSLFRGADESEEAIAHYRRNFERTRAFSENHPESRLAQDQMTDSLTRLANIMVELASSDHGSRREEKFEEAEAIFQKCEDRWQEMIRRWPQETQMLYLRLKYGDFLFDRARAALVRSNYRDALKYNGQALSIFGEIYDDDQRNMLIRLFYAGAISRHAFIATKYKALESASTLFLAGEKLWRELVADDPRRQYVHEWARILITGGLLRLEQGRGNEAEDLLNEAEDLLNSLRRVWPEDEAYLSSQELIREYRQRLEPKPAAGAQ